MARKKKVDEIQQLDEAYEAMTGRRKPGRQSSGCGSAILLLLVLAALAFMVYCFLSGAL